jgi:class III poly(R)-hydroxyalkanoic acid synthase PhaE subunit
MDDKSPAQSSRSPMFEDFLKASTEFWVSVAKLPFIFSEAAGNDLWWEKVANGRALETWESSVKTMQAISSLLSESARIEGIFKGIETFPELMVKVVQPAWNGFFFLQQEWTKAAERIGESASAYNFENLEQDAFQAFVNVYDKEFRHFLNIPQLGLTRVYQENFRQAMDRLSIFQATMGEFMALLYLPVEKSLKVMREELATMADQGRLPESSKDLYRMWVKILEGHYMNLFKTPHFTQTLGKTVDAMSSFIVARKKIIEDALQFLPVPTQTEMDDLYREIYLLKKRVKELEKNNRSRKTPVRTESPAGDFESNS